MMNTQHPHRNLARGAGILLVISILLLTACTGKDTHLLRPNGVVPAPDGSIYVMDRGNHRLVHLAANGRFLTSFGQLGLNPEDIYAGWDMTQDNQGRLYISDFVYEGDTTQQDSIKRFNSDGRFIDQLGFASGEARESPYGLDIDAQNRLYVASYRTNSVRVFDLDGHLLARLQDPDHPFSGLNDVVVDNQRHFLYVTNSMSSNVTQFALADDAAGLPTITYRLSFGSYGDGVDQFAYPLYLAVNDQTGWLYVGDMANQRIQVFDSEGVYQQTLLPEGVETWQVMGLNLAPDGTLYAADAFNNAVWVFAPDGRPPQRFQP